LKAESLVSFSVASELTGVQLDQGTKTQSAFSLSNGTPRPSTQTWRLLESKIDGQLCASGWFE
jgi:hypothetical protein